ncbi:hypothetical protein D3C75_623900 [compost metagenome]
MAGERIRANHADEALVDLEEVHLEGLQIGQAGVACAEVVDGDEDPELMQLGKQPIRRLVRHYQLPFGQLQHQLDGVPPEGADKVPTIVQQAQILAVAGADVETEVEPPGQLIHQGGKRLPHLGHQQPGHGDYEAAILRERNEAIRRDHALAGMLPAH